MCNFEHHVLVWDSFVLAWGSRTAFGLHRMSGSGVSNIAHYCDIDIGNMQLKMKEILLWAGCRIGGNIIYRDCII